jgi:3-dehydroquinate synthase
MHRLGLLSRAAAQRLDAVIERAGLPVRAPQWSYEHWLALMSVDKKAEQGAPRFVVLEGIGRASLRRVPEAALRETLAGQA